MKQPVEQVMSGLTQWVAWDYLKRHAKVWVKVVFFILNEESFWN